MKINKLLLSLASIGVLTLTSCKSNPLSSFSKKINSSLKNVDQVIMTTTITDDDIEVYKLVKTINLNYDGKNVSGIIDISEYTLSTNFTYINSTSSDMFEGQTKDIKFGLNLDKKYLSEFKIEDDVLTASVNKDSAKMFFGVDKVDCSINPDVKIVLADKKISTYDCTYTTNGDKDVAINILYLYNN